MTSATWNQHFYCCMHMVPDLHKGTYNGVLAVVSWLQILQKHPSQTVKYTAHCRSCLFSCLCAGTKNLQTVDYRWVVHALNKTQHKILLYIINTRIGEHKIILVHGGESHVLQRVGP
jgi:hypothetical protein